jgi:hypothetical protein
LLCTKLPAKTASGAGQMTRAIKNATVKRFHYDIHDELHRRFAEFVGAYICLRKSLAVSAIVLCDLDMNVCSGTTMKFRT